MVNNDLGTKINKIIGLTKHQSDFLNHWGLYSIMKKGPHQCLMRAFLLEPEVPAPLCSLNCLR